MMVPEFVLAEIILQGRAWLGWAVGLSALAAIALLWAYTQSNFAVWVRAIAALLKIACIGLLAALVLEPFAAVDAHDRAALEAEGEALLHWAEDEAVSRDIRWTE